MIAEQVEQAQMQDWIFIFALQNNHFAHMKSSENVYFSALLSQNVRCKIITQHLVGVF